MTTTIELGDTASEQTQKILALLPGLVVTRGTRGATSLHVGQKRVPVMLLDGGIAPLARDIAPFVRQVAGEGQLPLVVAPRLAEHVRRELEHAGVAYADGTGAAHIDAEGIYLHIEPKPAAKRLLTPPPGLGVVAVRVVQCLLADRDREWSVTEAAKAADCSNGEVHHLLTRLEDDGFVTSERRGRDRRRKVERPGELLDWLGGVPSARRLRERLYIYLYGRDPMTVVTRLVANGLKAKIDYVVTGAAGAMVFGTNVVTAIPTIMVRVDPNVALEVAAEAFKAEPVDTGANVVLIRDVGRLGVHQRDWAPPVPIAHPVRIYLDMLTEPRGDDAAALFRELIIGY